MFFKLNFNTILIIILLGWNFYLLTKINKIQQDNIILDDFRSYLIYTIFGLTFISTYLITFVKKICC